MWIICMKIALIAWDINLLWFSKNHRALCYSKIQIHIYIFWNASISKTVIFYAQISKHMKKWMWNNRARITADLFRSIFENHSSFVSDRVGPVILIMHLQEVWDTYQFRVWLRVNNFKCPTSCLRKGDTDAV